MYLGAKRHYINTLPFVCESVCDLLSDAVVSDGLQ